MRIVSWKGESKVEFIKIKGGPKGLDGSSYQGGFQIDL